MACNYEAIRTRFVRLFTWRENQRNNIDQTWIRDDPFQLEMHRLCYMLEYNYLLQISDFLIRLTYDNMIDPHNSDIFLTLSNCLTGTALCNATDEEMHEVGLHLMHAVLNRLLSFNQSLQRERSF